MAMILATAPNPAFGLPNLVAINVPDPTASPSELPAGFHAALALALIPATSAGAVALARAPVSA